MRRGVIILLNGFPGIGKYTIAKELSYVIPFQGYKQPPDEGYRNILPGSRVLVGIHSKVRLEQSM
jgi:MoxR-like ATPase